MRNSFCHLCGAWRGSLGLEPTPDLYVSHLVEVFREVRRVLRDDGTVWLNLGDSYASSTKGSGGNGSTGSLNAARNSDGSYTDSAAAAYFEPRRFQLGGLKPKDLCGIPWRVAFALQADGWWLRSDIIWAKGLSFCDTYSGSCMPESVRDRPTKGHEYVFLLTKSARYYYDQEAAKEKGGDGSDRWGGSTMDLATNKAFGGDAVIGQQANRPMRTFEYNGTRNLRSVWAINPGSFPGAHFATFPPALVEPMIKAGTSERGCCPECGAAWERVVEKNSLYNGNRSGGDIYTGQAYGDHPQSAVRGPKRNLDPGIGSATTGWTPTCTCLVHAGGGPDDVGELYGEPPDPVPCVCLDPFGGSGTVGLVADRLGRDAILCELNPEYVTMAEDRIYNDAPLFAEVLI